MAGAEEELKPLRRDAELRRRDAELRRREAGAGEVRSCDSAMPRGDGAGRKRGEAGAAVEWRRRGLYVW